MGFSFTATPASLLTSLLIYEGLLYRHSRIVSINSIDSTMEPTFAASTSETVTAELQAQLDAAIAAILQRYVTNPSWNEVFQSKEAAFTRL